MAQKFLVFFNRFLRLDSDSWYDLLYARYLVARPTIQFKLCIVWVYFSISGCFVLSFINFFFTKKSTSRLDRLLVGDIFIAMGTDGSKAVFISAMMGALELLCLQSTWLYWQSKGKSLVRQSDSVVRYSANGTPSVGKGFELTKKVILVFVLTGVPFFLLNAALTLTLTHSAKEVILLVVDVTFWLVVIYVIFPCYPLHAGFWLHRMSKWQRELNSVESVIIQFENSMSQMAFDDKCKLLARFAIDYQQFRSRFFKVNAQLLTSCDFWASRPYFTLVVSCT